MISDDARTHWKQLRRTSLVDTPFIRVYSDKIQLPAGQIIEDYTVVSLPDGVVVVATDEHNRLITQFEYKYAVDRTILNLPSGGVDPGQGILQAAAKELREETGYVSDDLELIQSIGEYPSKQTHSLHIVRAKNARKVVDVEHEVTESISKVNLITSDMDNYGGVFDMSYTIAAIAGTVPDFLKKNS